MRTVKSPAKRFQELAAKVSAPSTGLLATSHVPAASAATRHAARLMVGGLDADDGRITRIAASLSRLVELNQPSVSVAGKQRRGPGR